MRVVYKKEFCVECNKKTKERNMIQVKFRTNKPVTVFRCPQCDNLLIEEKERKNHGILTRVNGFCETCEEKVMVTVLCHKED